MNTSGLTDKALGKKVKCSRASISAIENGSRVSRFIVARIARVLDADPAEITLQPESEKAA